MISKRHCCGFMAMCVHASVDAPTNDTIKQVFNKRIRLSISATGIVLAPMSRDDAIINFYPMKNISLATGGEDLEYVHTKLVSSRRVFYHLLHSNIPFDTKYTSNFVFQ